MPAADTVTPARAADDARPLERAVAREAAAWLVRLHDSPTREDLAACERWRAADPEHERAWQRAQQLNAKFGVVPAHVGLPVLGRKVRAGRRTATKTLTLLLVAGPAGYLAYRTTPWREWAADQRTATGERRSVTLADGTRVDLNTSTAFDVVFSRDERRLVLHAGEILVETGPDLHRDGGYRPFVVQTSQGRVRALGTRFVVRSDDGGDRTRVAVLQSAVEITPASAARLARVVVAGQQACFTATSVGPTRAADPHVADWTRGMLFAEHMRLGDFLAELGRYRRGLLRCDPAVADLAISGAFQIDRADDILAALPQTLPVRVVARTRYWITVIPAGA
ncbi:FecR domain-containing protein [Paraburkholderia caballeronis]|uniref:FecR domain-containing protein n=1 Tax=Paraburkholderia caballeronis TaxID=416943 RepID=UPI00106493A0|nr:FecR domain-containing protein [Paraburkholderia caballeronis]TDV07111.1 FecR family protein [Paraburkholderia caballeronis]TDV11255.1 FecR family protein [Paraburkholderia caballeronis]TDV22440.1 FecR family protein [Paraburkholderia caballeronis]